MKVTNLDRVNAKIKALPQVAKDEMRKAVAASADEIVALQKKLAPIDDGDLQMSITWGWGNEKKIAYSQTIGTVAGKTELSARISVGNTKVRYAHIVEWGSAPHMQGGQFAGTQHPGTAAQAFFYPGWRFGKKRAKARIKRAITKAAKEVAKS